MAPEHQPESKANRSAPGGSTDAVKPRPDEIRNQLASILASEFFVASHRLCRFLRFVVERTLENDLDRLKEFVVALEVFDRDENYDPNIDSIVRVEARRLRSKLRAYYDSHGSGDSILISLRPGSYVPVIESRNIAKSQPDTTSPRIPAELDSDISVAVLPFINISPEPEQDYFCDGITEEIINALAAVDGLSVVARTSAFQFKAKAVDIREVGEKLGAQVVVEGSVRKSGSQLRITAQAINAARGYHLWSETFRREIHDVFEIQEEISKAVAEVLRVKLRPGTGRGKDQPSLEAYTGFLQGRFLLRQETRDSLAQALEQFQKVAAAFPEYAPPYAGIAAAYGYLALYGAFSGSHALPHMKRNVEIALRLDPNSADACAAMAGISAHWEYDWNNSEEYFRRTLSLQPGHADAHCWYGMMLAALGRFAEAETELRLSTKMDPLSAPDFVRRAYLSYIRGDFDGAVTHFEKAFTLAPNSEGRLFYAEQLIQQAAYSAAEDLLAPGLDKNPLPILLGMLAAVYFRWGKPEKAKAVLERLASIEKKRYVSPHAYALAAIGSGDTDAAFTALDQTIADKNPRLIFLKVDPYYAPLKADPRFETLLRRLNLNSDS